MISAPTFKRANRAEPTDMRRFMRDNRVKHYFLCNAYPRKAIVTVSRADGIRPYSGDRCPQVLTTPYRAKLRIILLNCEKPCRARREVLHARERTLIRDRTGMVLTTQYHAELRIAGCQFLRKVGNSGILCETRSEVLRTRERTSVRDQVLRFSQCRITRNYALPDISRCLRGRRYSSPQCIPHHCRAERRRHPAEPEPARQLPCRPSRRSHRT